MEGTNSGTTAIEIVRHMVKAVPPDREIESCSPVGCEVACEAEHVSVAPHGRRGIVCCWEFGRRYWVKLLQLGKGREGEVEVVARAMAPRLHVLADKRE